MVPGADQEPLVGARFSGRCVRRRRGEVMQGGFKKDVVPAADVEPRNGETMVLRLQVARTPVRIVIFMCQPVKVERAHSGATQQWLLVKWPKLEMLHRLKKGRDELRFEL